MGVMRKERLSDQEGLYRSGRTEAGGARWRASAPSCSDRLHGREQEASDCRVSIDLAPYSLAINAGRDEM